MAGLPLQLESPSAAVVVPMATTPGRERERGYNQAALLARAYASALDLEYVEALRRRAGAVSQVSLRPSERRANVRNAFRIRSPAVARVAGRQVLLIDDVLTTGATACEAADTLERGGATGVTVVTFARALPDRRREDA